MSDERRKADLRSRRYAGLGACLGERRVGRIRRSVQVAKVSEHRGKLCEEGGFCRPFGAVALITRIPGAHARRLLTVAPLGLKGGGVGGGGGPSHLACLGFVVRPSGRRIRAKARTTNLQTQTQLPWGGGAVARRWGLGGNRCWGFEKGPGRGYGMRV